MVTIGIDPHKSTHTAVALDAEGRILGELRVAATRTTVERLLRWADPWPERTWAVEGASGLGHFLAQRLVACGEIVLDVPAKLAARARLLDRGYGRKTDAIDAASVARVTLRHVDLRRVGPEDNTAVLRLLSDRRDEITGERRRVINRLHRLLRDLHPGGAPTELSTAAAARLLGQIRPETTVDRERKALARALIADLRRIDRALAENRKRCASAVAASGTTLTAIFGISDVIAAMILGHVGTSPASRPPTASPATRARRRSRSQAARSPGTACPGTGTGTSTTHCTSSPMSRRCIRGLVETTTSARSPSTSRRARPFGVSSASLRRSFIAISSPIRSTASPWFLDIEALC